MTVILTSSAYNPYLNFERDKFPVSDLAGFIGIVRASFEDRDDAIAVCKEGVITALWLREPDIDCDAEGQLFEVSSDYPGTEYVLYRPDYKSFWNYVAYHFGEKYVPEGHGYSKDRHPRAYVSAERDCD